MKSAQLLALAVVGIAVCDKPKTPVTHPAQQATTATMTVDTAFHPSWSRHSVIYEVNVRQYTALELRS